MTRVVSRKTLVQVMIKKAGNRNEEKSLDEQSTYDRVRSKQGDSSSDDQDRSYPQAEINDKDQRTEHRSMTCQNDKSSDEQSEGCSNCRTYSCICEQQGRQCSSTCQDRKPSDEYTIIKNCECQRTHQDTDPLDEYTKRTCYIDYEEL